MSSFFVDGFLVRRSGRGGTNPGPCCRQPAPAEGAGGGEGAGAGAGAGGSPVPGRNTARVCAKFAELTLTGGSLKPALAAKPALLRRPRTEPC